MSRRRIQSPDPAAQPARRNGRGGRIGRIPPEHLGGEEVQRLRQVLRRLAAELRAALSPLLQRAQGPSAVARALSIDRATAHRSMALAHKRAADLDDLAEAPGPDAIDQLASALRSRRLTPPPELRALAQAVLQYRAALHDLAGGSKSRLLRRIAATESTATTSEVAPASVRARREQDLREQLFSITSELLGRHTHTRVDLMICRPNPDDPRVMDYAQVRAVIGHRSRPQAQPITVELLGRVTAAPGAQNPVLTLDGRAVETDFADTIIAPFSTQPLPVAISRGVGDRVRNVVDTTYTAAGKSVDVVVGYQRPRACAQPRFDELPALEVGALVREPSRWLVLDTYLHRDMTTGAVPSLETYLWSPTIQTSLADHWLDRLPTSPLLRVLGRGTRNAASVAWPRLSDLTTFAFEQLGWSAQEYVGYRAEIDYPMWGGAYFAVFDYSP